MQKKEFAKKMKRLKHTILSDILRFRYEYFITPLFLVLLIFSFKYIGFTDFRNITFNICLLIEIPSCFYGLRIARKVLYKVYIGKEIEHED